MEGWRAGGDFLFQGHARSHVSTRQDEWYPLEKSAAHKDRLAVRFASAEQLFFDGGHRAPSAAFDEIRAFLARNG